MMGVRRRRDRAAGIYLHVPFCARICPYCDFAVTAKKRIPHERYAEALMAEFDARASALEGRAVRTIYFGGGTPSRWAPEQLGRVLEHVRRSEFVDVDALEEISIEANPVDVTEANLAVWREAGVGRVSLGCQSFQSEVLEALGREHTGAEARAAAARVLAAGMRASIDLIFGAPRQAAASWEADLEIFAALALREGLDHLSAYSLTIEPRTPFARQVARGELEVASEEALRERTERLAEVCARVGFEPYEVSSWCAPGGRSRHNSLYWLGAEYLGVGVGAHSLRIDERGVARRANTRHLAHYLADPIASCERELLTAEEHLAERVFVGVRTRLGLDLDELSWQFAGAVGAARLEAIASRADALVTEGLLERRGALLRPTREGLMVADALGEALI